jgi:hypothetical protein
MFEELELAIKEIQQPRSKFQLEKFVLGQHPTPEMQYYQLCQELQSLIYTYKASVLSLKKNQIKVGRLRATGDEIDEIKAQEIELAMEQTSIVMIGAERELSHLTELWRSFEHKYTRDEIELAQLEYWKARLSGNVEAMLLSGSAVNPAHLETMAQAGLLQEFIDKKLEAEISLQSLETENKEPPASS